MPADSFESPLTLAACGGHHELAALLISRGADLEEVNDEGLVCSAICNISSVYVFIFVFVCVCRNVGSVVCVSVCICVYMCVSVCVCNQGFSGVNICKY